MLVWNLVCMNPSPQHSIDGYGPLLNYENVKFILVIVGLINLFGLLTNKRAKLRKKKIGK